MISYINNKDLNVEKYNFCVENAVQSRIYAFSWYLDIVAENWDVLVLNDYEAVMPIPWRKKYGIKYVFPPFWILELGIFSKHEIVDYSLFFNEIFKKFSWIDLRFNSSNYFESSSNFLVSKEFQLLDISNEYAHIFDNYRKDRKKDIVKATEFNLSEKWNDSIEKLIELFKENVGKRVSNLKLKEYDILAKLLQKCVEKKVGEVLSIYDENENLVASGFFLKHQKTATILLSATDFKNRNNGANSFLIDCAIKKYQKEIDIFHFGGSSIKSIASYFLSFGAKTHQYYHIKYNNLPFFIRFFKS